MTFMEFTNRFPTQKACIDYYLTIRYPEGFRCNHCGSKEVYHRNSNPKVFDCRSCRNTYSPFKDTIFEKSCTDLRKWFYALRLFLNGKKGISGLQLKREIGVTYKTAWRMLQQIRIAMGNAEHKEFFDTIIEMDETYIGGKPRKDNNHNDNDNPPNKRGRGTKKTPVVGVIDRVNKIVYAKVPKPNIDGKQLTAKQLLAILNKVSKPNNRNTIITDEFVSYISMLKGEYLHLKVDHRQFFAVGDVHTNTIESFWATLKRGVYGIYHHISVKYLQRYVNEFCFRYNNRKQDMFSMVLGQAKI